MLLTIKTTRYPATDLGYLLHKHPAKVQQVSLSAGSAHIFYPEATEQSCTAALLLDIDPVHLVRKGANEFALDQYVNDRPYVASSFMSNAISYVYSSAMNGRCKDKPELTTEAIPYEVSISVLRVKGGEKLLRQLFEPLGYEVMAEQLMLDPLYEQWGMSQYFKVTLRNTLPLTAILRQLYILMPVCDNDKHYYMDSQEVEKLNEKGKGWLETHPEQEMITRRYLKNIAALTKEALSTNLKEEGATDDEKPKEKIRLHDLRLNTVRDLLGELKVATVVDLGCGEGKFLRLLKDMPALTKVLGMDVSYSALEIAKHKLKLNKLPEAEREKFQLMQGSLTYRDTRLSGFDAGVLIEVIEHLDLPRLEILERVVFEFARPKHLIVTTVNVEYNVMYEKLQPGEFRHGDHRFEWTRAEFQAWGNKVAEQFRYNVSYQDLGEVHETYGAPSQLALFTIPDTD
ncbi:3' terminal RNA ribose 2'-O-methyltransferase Hen1 [Chitinophaga sp. Cy-1792]|uniref:3' terminal RNA ribose 2'-O-methyltransferase Hen1 n=1 Tax=Chitinophaga sp. Cy-1792 TaxID=2608339 RepID=UPI0014211080|nr:3' terminal RNA ribose 2'-O-methyltransferase Hen1 [Chitinophaga sp. Cy-1792]NIG55100.1 3' terminal RNA ribose 2'-O-methyltransferase Hen1 [Chitinophaga sp. Cy-1792]